MSLRIILNCISALFLNNMQTLNRKIACAPPPPPHPPHCGHALPSSSSSTSHSLPLSLSLPPPPYQRCRLWCRHSKKPFISACSKAIRKS
jgi:hypothetical protein